MAGDSKAGNRSLPVDPNLPRWVCQNCRHAICVVGLDSFTDKFFPSDPSRSGMQASVRMDQSYVVLPKQQKPAGIPPRPTGKNSSGTHQQQQQYTSGSGAKAMEESFVVLPPAAASMYNGDNSSSNAAVPVLGDSGEAQVAGLVSSPDGPVQQGGNAGFNASISVLSRAFEIAAAQSQVEQPLCLECLRVLSDKLDKEVDDVNRDIKAYEACIQRSESESHKALSEDEFLKEKKKLEEEERKLQAAIEEIERQFSEVSTEKEDLESKSKQFRDLEERYWHEFNNFQFQLISHQEERDAILAKVEVSQAHLERLKGTNVLNDAFHISHEGEFGTINNFRLGRLPKILVEWDEINAAWGQACLLLHTMAQYFRPKFQYRIKILPMGSYPRIMDTTNNTYELFGPVNLFWSTRYDKAMTLFLTCLKEFAEFANQRDQENNIPAEKCLKLPYRIENDKVESYTITQSFNKQENWTKALKYTLCNLKWMLYWFVGNTSFQPISAMASSRAEVPSVASQAKRSTEKKV